MAPRIEPCAKRIRTYVGGIPIADSTRTLLVWEERPYPTYYFPTADVGLDALREHGIEARTADAAELHGYVTLPWSAMDNWFEEDEEVYTHARSPYTRVDILASSRPVRVERDGVVLAESKHAHVLFETGLPARWYFPKVDVHMDLLTSTDRVSHCPYKGQAEYWAVRVGDKVIPDLAWSYRTPLPESQKIAGMVSFYNERVDLFIDGELQERPNTRM
jgi:uncharacterized protein (DUF427 family)